jgi:hypothetical protein
MNFGQLQQTQDSSTPVAELHSKYNRLTHGKSRSLDWKKILQRISYEEAIQLQNYLARQPYPIKSESVVSRLDELLHEMQFDPVARKVPVSQMALDVCERISESGNDIDPEYVADALIRYTEYLFTVAKGREHACLPTAREFVYEWFTVLATYGSPRMRVFHLEHPKWKKYLTDVRRFAERG